MSQTEHGTGQRSVFQPKMSQTHGTARSAQVEGFTIESGVRGGHGHEKNATRREPRERGVPLSCARCISSYTVFNYVIPL